jgi:hypothetical protein
MATYLDRIAAAGARRNLPAQPSPAAPPVFPGPVAGASLGDEAPMFQQDLASVSPSSSISQPSLAGLSASEVSIQPSRPAAPAPSLAVRSDRDTPEATIPRESSKPVTAAFEAAPPPRPSPPILPALSPVPMARSVRSATSASRPPERIPRIVTHRPGEAQPQANPVRISAQQPALPVSASGRATGPSRSSDSEPRAPEPFAQTTQAEPKNVPPTPVTSSVTSTRAATIGTPSIAPAFPGASRHTEPESRITIGRIDVLVNNQLPPRRAAPAAAAAQINVSNTLRAQFQDRFSLQR